MPTRCSVPFDSERSEARRLWSELHLLDELADALAQRAAVQPVELAVHRQHLLHGEVVVEVRLLGQEADRGARARRRAAGRGTARTRRSAAAGRART